MTNPPTTPPEGDPSERARTEGREPTTSLSAFRDLSADPGTPKPARIRRWSGEAAATTALICGIGVALASVVVGILGSLNAMKDSPLIVALFALLVVVTLLTAFATTRAFLHYRRTGSGGWVRGLIGTVVAVGCVAILANLFFSPDPAERAPGNGPITAGGPLRVGLLLEGDCLTEVPAARYGTPDASVRVAPCDETHAVEVVAVLDFDDGGDDATLLARCEDATQDNGRTGEVHLLAPTQEFRATYNTGQLLCLQA